MNKEEHELIKIIESFDEEKKELQKANEYMRSYVDRAQERIEKLEHELLTQVKLMNLILHPNE